MVFQGLLENVLFMKSLLGALGALGMLFIRNGGK